MFSAMRMNASLLRAERSKRTGGELGTDEEGWRTSLVCAVLCEPSTMLLIKMLLKIQTNLGADGGCGGCALCTKLSLRGSTQPSGDGESRS